MSVIAYNLGRRKDISAIMLIGMKLREDDITQDTGEPQRKRPEEPGNYYYDDSTGYELYEPTTSLEDDEPEGQKLP